MNVPKAYAMRASHLLTLSVQRIQRGEFGKARGALAAAKGNLILSERDIKEAIYLHTHSS